MDISLLNNLKKIVEQLLEISIEYNVKNNLIRKLKNFKVSLEFPYLIIFLGEVNSGKSSLINSILDKKVCNVDSLPETDKIYIIRFTEANNKFLKSYIQGFNIKIINVDSDEYPDVSFVDTPGVNSIIKEHTVLTEDFFQVADLIVYLIQITDIYKKTIWEDIKTIKDWNKKLIIVISKIDLEESEQIKKHYSYVENHLMQMDLKKVKIFTVSSKMYDQAIKKGDEIKAEYSGIKELKKEFKILANNKEIFKHKIENLINGIDKILEILEIEAKEMSKIISNDVKLLHKIDSLIEEYQSFINEDLNKCKNLVLKKFDEEEIVLIESLKDEIDRIGSFKNFLKFNKKKNEKLVEKFLGNLIEEVNKQVELFNNELTTKIDLLIEELNQIIYDSDNNNKFEFLKKSKFTMGIKNKLLILEKLKKEIDEEIEIKFIKTLKYGGLTLSGTGIILGLSIPFLITHIIGLIFTIAGLIMALPLFKKQRKKFFEKKLRMELNKSRKEIENHFEEILKPQVNFILHRIKNYFKDFRENVMNNKNKIERFIELIDKNKKEIEKIKFNY